MEKEQRILLVRIVTALVLGVALQFIPLTGWLRLAAFLLVYLIVGYDVLWEAVEGILHGEVFDEHFLMGVATLGAFALAIYKGTGDYNEAIAVMLFYQIGEFFQDYAVEKSRGEITALMDIRPDYANIERGGRLERIDPAAVETGTVIVVQPGEKIPIDGVVREGSSSLNTAALTGESVPRDVVPGDEVISGCVNLTGRLRIETTRAFGESTVSQILKLMEESAERKAKSEAFITRFARIYTPVVCFAALALAVIPPLVGTFAPGGHFGDTFPTWLYRALTFLVISCPCALVVSIPLSFFAGIGGASKAGILVKGSNYLETLSKVRTVVFDKTGTLTLGTFQVEQVCPADESGLPLLEYAALAESASSHPISLSLRKAYGRETDGSRVTDIHEQSGYGVTACIDGRRVAVGNEKLMMQEGAGAVHAPEGGTLVHVAVDGTYAGHIVLGDAVKPGARQALRSLHEAGVTKTVMLTGDSRSVAKAVAATVGVDEVYGELLPDGKVKQLEALLQAAGKDEKVAFVGDGINDAPVLRRADIGIAMGALGSDAAIEAADVVLMDDDPRKVATAVRMSRRTLRIVWQNICFALGVKAVCLVLAALGLAGMWLAVFADVGVLILAILNAIRAMYPPKETVTA